MENLQETTLIREKLYIPKAERRNQNKSREMQVWVGTEFLKGTGIPLHRLKK